MSKVSDAEWLEEAARYFENRSTGGEDMAFWANVSNAERCRSIAQSLRSQPEPAGVRVKGLEWEADDPTWWVAQPAVMIGGAGYEVRVTGSGKVLDQLHKEGEQG